MSDKTELKKAKAWINILLRINDNPQGEHEHIRASAFEFANDAQREQP